MITNDEPADAKNENMYVGLDISTKKGVEGAAFIMFDPYGMFIGARKIELKSETLGYDDYYEIQIYDKNCL